LEVGSGTGIATRPLVDRGFVVTCVELGDRRHSWHWIDPSVGYPKLAGLLGERGHLAVWTASHVFPVDGDDYFVELQEVYDNIGEGLPANGSWPSPDELEPPGVGAASNGLFATTAIERFDWELSYDTGS
jgi:hypothetical protein